MSGMMVRTNLVLGEYGALLDHIKNTYNYYIYELEDPRVKNWYIISSPLPTFTIIVFYLIFLYKILPSFMNNRKPFNLTFTIRLYNICQVVSCSLLVYQLVTPLSRPSYVWKCEKFRYSHDPVSLKRLSLSYYFYFIKLADLTETVFFVLRKKYSQVSTLHVYHHITTFMMAWFYCKYFAGGMVSFCMTLNSSIHVLMYSYYFFSSLGPGWQKLVSRWKSTLTMLQMMQLTILIIHSSQVLFNKTCNMPPITFYFYAPNVAIMLYMFRNFFRNTYIRKGNKKVL